MDAYLRSDDKINACCSLPRACNRAGKAVFVLFIRYAKAANELTRDSDFMITIPYPRQKQRFLRKEKTSSQVVSKSHSIQHPGSGILV